MAIAALAHARPSAMLARAMLESPQYIYNISSERLNKAIHWLRAMVRY